MRTLYFLFLSTLFLFVSCRSPERDLGNTKEKEGKRSSFALQYEFDLPTKVLKVGPNLEISIGKFALNSFQTFASQVFDVSSFKVRNENDTMEPGTILLRKVQVNRTLVFEEGTTNFHHASFASIVEFLLVKESGETFRILGQSEPIETKTIPFSPNDQESEKTISASIQSAIEVGLNKIIDSKVDGKLESNRMMFQKGY
ncbi:putative lipoprotein [Leptospira yanagawae serovar Saopaulo str. Sao Paulo = ATCC 700523]|uniref:Putative lipoprotein n=1 Tax=Leptospira yanagawae serovar Saopaulo str. Sao Paulo = ATCC 700523 TaxID=1249483 RepID=A0A5E8HH30_9LEPT|nr:hypothetical protein [Leptospira yanagawae]EOQ90595.1 putative lipoprotein [Leptospira yanagawae serovar Saopaulo str. Sao Paulo = ATCC 700523]